MKQNDLMILGAFGIGAYLLMTQTGFGKGLTKRVTKPGALQAGARASDSAVSSGGAWVAPFGGQLVVPFVANAGSPMMVNNAVPSWNNWSWITVK